MSAQEEFNFTDADYHALRYFLFDAASVYLACRAAGIPRQQFNEGVFSAIVPCLRGAQVDFDRFVKAKTIVEGDRLRLDYEVRLAQLNRQHQMCVDAYRRTDENAQRQAATNAAQKDAEPLKQKSLTGDIRFLQLARAIRHEMNVLEKMLKERLELLHSWQERAESRNKSASTAEANAPAKPSLAPLSPPQSGTATVVKNPSNEAEKQPQPRSPEVVKASSPAQVLQPKTLAKPLLRRDDFLAALDSSQIPVIDPPPRRADKFAKPKAA